MNIPPNELYSPQKYNDKELIPNYWKKNALSEMMWGQSAGCLDERKRYMGNNSALHLIWCPKIWINGWMNKNQKKENVCESAFWRRVDFLWLKRHKNVNK